jgi:hypothetical protein
MSQKILPFWNITLCQWVNIPDISKEPRTFIFKIKQEDWIT